MRVGLVGAGRIGAFHGATLRDHEDVDEVIVADANPDAAARLAAGLGVSCVPSVPDAFSCELDAVVIAAATTAHAELIHAAAEARISIFCEKPIALDLAETHDVIEHVAEVGVPLQVGFQRRFDAGYRNVRRQLVGGQLGRVYSIRMVAADAERPPAGYLPSSGGIFRDMHIHDFDLVRWLTANEVEWVYATGSSLGFEEFEAVADLAAAVAVLTMGDGALVTITGCRDNPSGYDVRAEVAASRGSITTGLDRRTPLKFDNEAPPWTTDVPYRGFLDRFGNAYRAEIRAFLDVARGRAESPCTGNDALEALRVAIAAEASRTEQRPIRLAEVV